MKKECKLRTVLPPAAVGKFGEYYGFQLLSKGSLKQMCWRSRKDQLGDRYESLLTLTLLVSSLDNGTEFHDTTWELKTILNEYGALKTLFNYFSDGTISTAPTNLFSHLYTVHGEITAGEEKNVLPLVYVFLPNKHQRTYEKMLEVIREKVDLNSRTWIVYFKKGAINAIEMY